MPSSVKRGGAEKAKALLEVVGTENVGCNRAVCTQTVPDLAHENWLPCRGKKLFKQSLDSSDDLGHLDVSPSFAIISFQDEHSSCHFNNRLDTYKCVLRFFSRTIMLKLCK